MHNLIIYLKKRWAQRQTQNLADIMSLNCQLEKIKANKSNDKSMLRQIKSVYILKTTENFLGHPVLKLLYLRKKVLAETSSSVWTINRSSDSSYFPTCVSLSSLSISPSSLLTILDQGFPTLYPLLLSSWPGNGFELILGVSSNDTYPILMSSNNLFLNTNMVLASQLGLVPDREWWL